LQATRPRVLIEGSTKIDKKNFVGLPIPPAAGLLAGLVHFAPLPLNAYGESLSNFYGALILVLLAVLGLLMVSTLRYTSFKTTASGRRSLYLILLIAAIGMLVWLYSRYVLLALALAYVSHGIIWYVLSLFRRPKQVEEVQT
jgi:CDP-diacylglycerol--serine O-phosphatidyltransferase